jgi:cell division protease FtsH
VGFSGADLENLCNEAAIYAVRTNTTTISQANFETALDKITIGEERKIIIPESKKTIISYHEAGHTLVALLLSDADTVRKVTIVPRGYSGGITYFEPLDENIDFGLVTRDYLETKIKVALGGRAAEEIVFGKNKLTTGAAGDLVEVQNIARTMITMYGFNDNIGVANWEQTGSDSEINAEVTELINRLYDETLMLLENNRDILNTLASLLLEKETLYRDDLLSLLESCV